MAVRQKGYCVLCKSLRLNIRWVCDNIGVNGFALRQEVDSRAAIAVIRQIGRQNRMAVPAKDLGDVPAAAARFPNTFREAFEL